MLLLSHDASANIVDHKGCTPLHLASWSGNAEIVELLLTQGTSFPSVNHMVNDYYVYIALVPVKFTKMLFIII